MHQFCSIKQVQEIMNLSQPTLYRHIKSGEIPAVRIGGRVLIPASFIQELEDRTRAPKQLTRAQR
jgi:excisionase family DNA binding protein